jgi:eukaryotic-like serine/threonine-protein kinase
MDLTVQNVYGLLLRSRLLSVDEARTMFARWNQEAKEAASNAAQFSRWMVANRYLTEYQASLLARGHADGFFLTQYKILDRLGKGRMAGVYKAQHETGPVVAIKVLPPSKSKDPGLLARFQREARLALKLKHPNVVRTFQVGEGTVPGSPDRLYYLVMEYIEGETLEDILQRRRQFPPGEAVRLIYQALLGLHHLHDHGLVHRDIKPANLMLSYGPGPVPPVTLNATVKILDMGLARALSDAVGPDKPGDVQPALTSEGIVLGTPDYMAPEQARDARQADIRADIYSLGCVLYHLLDGKPPFPDTNIISQMIRHATETPRPLKEANPAVPDGLQQIINWMLAKDPNQRYPTPDRAAQALKVFLVAGAEPAPLPESDPKMRGYLTWLEVDNRDREKTPNRPVPVATVTPGPTTKPPSGTPPVAATKPPSGTLPVARPIMPAANNTPPARHHPKGSKKKGKKRKSQLALRVPSPQPPPPPAIDVELVTLPPPAAAVPPKAIGLPLTRRDLVMFGLGAGTVGLAGGLGLVGALLLGAFRKKEPPPEQ